MWLGRWAGCDPVGLPLPPSPDRHPAMPSTVAVAAPSTVRRLKEGLCLGIICDQPPGRGRVHSVRATRPARPRITEQSHVFVTTRALMGVRTPMAGGVTRPVAA